MSIVTAGEGGRAVRGGTLGTVTKPFFSDKASYIFAFSSPLPHLGKVYALKLDQQLGL